jgi:hypothetical protein
VVGLLQGDEKARRHDCGTTESGRHFKHEIGCKTDSEGRDAKKPEAPEMITDLSIADNRLHTLSARSQTV